MTHTRASTADLVRYLTRDADRAESEGQAWEAVACRVGAFYLAAVEREHAAKAAAACMDVLNLFVEASERQAASPTSKGSVPRPAGLH